MKRDLRKALDQYEKLSNNGQEKLYLSDLQQVAQIARERSTGNFTFDSICIAFEAGYAIGFRQAKSQAKRRAKRA